MATADDRNGELNCTQCGEIFEPEEALECIGITNGLLDLIIDCPHCGATYNAFVAFRDFQVVQ